MLAFSEVTTREITYGNVFWAHFVLNIVPRGYTLLPVAYRKQIEISIHTEKHFLV